MNNWMREVDYATYCPKCKSFKVLETDEPCHECLKTEIVVTANYREWRNIFKLRTPVAAHPQMRELMCPLLMELQKKIPVVFDDIYTYWPADDQTRKGSMVK